MKKINYLLILMFVMLSQLTFGQSISIFDIDTTNFPTMKAKFYAFDKDGNRVTPSELSITEDGVPRNILSVSCLLQKLLHKNTQIPTSPKLLSNLPFQTIFAIPVTF